MQEEQNAWAQQSSAEQDSDTGSQIHHTTGLDRVIETESDSAKDLEYSESVYSSDEDNLGPITGAGVKRLNVDDTPAMYRTASYRAASTASSVDWKTWLSANIGKLEPSLSPSKPAEIEYTIPSTIRSLTSAGSINSSLRLGHVRERAQIHDEDEDD
ncbi:hypothetical protein N0V88_003667 [Collariella sp. IMI 366227]|nr:hypothetical protein N0V88_003667 [Collariella sp. IMI 366227]